MKIKVTFEKEFDSDEFYEDWSDREEYLKKLYKEEFFKGFKDDVYDKLDKQVYLIEDFKFEEIEENDNK